MTERPQAVVIGASAGAVQALLKVLPALPATYPIPILVVVHVPSDRDNALVGLFADKCLLKVKEAEEKEPALGGTIYFAPSDYHLLVEQDGTLSLSSDEPVHHSRPAIDVLFQSAADAWGEALPRRGSLRLRERRRKALITCQVNAARPAPARE